MSHTIYVLNVDGLGISDEALIGRVEGVLYNDDTLRYEGIDCFFPAKISEYLLSDFGVLERFFDENLTMTLTQEDLKKLLLERYQQVACMLSSCLNGEELGLFDLIANKHKIINRLEENSDAIFITTVRPERFFGLGAFLDNMYLFSVAMMREVKVRLIKGYKYYN